MLATLEELLLEVRWRLSLGSGSLGGQNQRSSMAGCWGHPHIYVAIYMAIYMVIYVAIFAIHMAVYMAIYSPYICLFFFVWPCIGHIWALYGSRGAIYGPSIPGTRPVISGAGRF